MEKENQEQEEEEKNREEENEEEAEEEESAAVSTEASYRRMDGQRGKGGKGWRERWKGGRDAEPPVIISHAAHRDMIDDPPSPG